MSIPDHIAENFAGQGMMATLGARMTAWGDGLCEIEAPLTPAVSQQHGAGHAGLAFSIGDSAAGYAAVTCLPVGGDVVTVEMKINLLSLAVGDKLRARGRVIRAGRRIIVTTAEVHALTGEEEKLIAILQGTMMPV